MAVEGELLFEEVLKKLESYLCLPKQDPMDKRPSQNHVSLAGRALSEILPIPSDFHLYFGTP